MNKIRMRICHSHFNRIIISIAKECLQTKRHMLVTSHRTKLRIFVSFITPIMLTLTLPLLSLNFSLSLRRTCTLNCSFGRTYLTRSHLFIIVIITSFAAVIVVLHIYFVRFSFQTQLQQIILFF